MEKEELIEALQKLPSETKICIAKDTIEDVDLKCHNVKSADLLLAENRSKGRSENIFVLFF